MADRVPTTEELAELGVEITSVKFREAKMRSEPPTDRKLTLPSGRKLRERITRTHVSQDRVQTSAARVAMTGFTLSISIAKLDELDNVVLDDQGDPYIAPVHEVLFTGEALARLGSEEVAIEALRVEREVAAARADAHFTGIELAERVFGGDRFVPPTPPTSELSTPPDGLPPSLPPRP